MIVRAAVFTGANTPLEVRELTYRNTLPQELLVRTTAAPFCASDWLGWRGMRNRQPPIVMGHTATGIVETVGSGVEKLQVGQRVIVGSTPQCEQCFYCGIGRPDQCNALFDQPEPEVSEIHGMQPVRAAGRVGAYASHMLVDQNQVWAVDTPLSDEVISLLGCGVLTGHGAVFNIAKVQPGQSVAVVGLGHLGQWMVQAASAAGASTIIGIDPHMNRRSLALRLGATNVVDPDVTEPVRCVRDLTEDRGADVVLEAAGPENAVQQAVSMSRRAGKVVLSGVQNVEGTVTLRHSEISLQGRTILSCQNGQVVMSQDLPLCIELIEDGTYDPVPIITSRYGINEVNDALYAAGEYGDLTGVFTSF